MRDGDHYVLDGVKQFISGAGRLRPLRHHGRAPADDGAGGHLDAGRSRRTRPASPSARNEKKMGWNAQPTRAGDLRGLPRARREPARRRRASASRSPWPASTAGGSTSAPARSAARRRRSTRRCLHERAQGVRQAHRRFPGAAVRARRHGDRAGSGAHLPVARGRRARRQGARRDAALRHGQALRAPMSASRSPTTRCSCTAATAISPITASRRSCATCACTRSSKAPTRSCA